MMFERLSQLIDFISMPNSSPKATLGDGRIHLVAEVGIEMKELMKDRVKIESLLRFAETHPKNFVEIISTAIYEVMIGPLDANFMENEQTLQTLKLISGIIGAWWVNSSEESVAISTSLDLPIGCTLLQ